MGSMKPTDTEVHDAHLHLRAVVARHRDGEGSQVGLIQCSHLNLAFSAVLALVLACCLGHIR
jgi:hypothetical protein